MMLRQCTAEASSLCLDRSLVPLTSFLVVTPLPPPLVVLFCCRPKLNKLCSEEKAVYCKDVKPGKARVIKCLIENMAQPNFGEECKEELQSREDVSAGMGQNGWEVGSGEWWGESVRVSCRAGTRGCRLQ